MNYCTTRADLDQTIDESTWGFAGYSGEAGDHLMNKPVKKGECCAMLCNSTLLLLPQLTILQLIHCDCHSSIAVIMLTRRWTNNHPDRHDPQTPTRTVHHQHSLQIRFATWQQLRITQNFTWCQRSKFFHCHQISKPIITSLVIMSWSTLLYCKDLE